MPQFLQSGDLLVLNNTKVLPHRLRGQRSTGGKVEVLLLQQEGGECRGYVKPARKIHSDEELFLEDGALILRAGALLDSGEMLFTLRAAQGSLEEALAKVGRAPLPPYIQRQGADSVAADRQRYQTVFAKVPGAVAAPTAGMHFTQELLQTLQDKGVGLAEVTLHVGPGTFAPVRVERVLEHSMHAEHFALEESVAQAVRETRRRGGRVVAVGTTAARTLESCAQADRLVQAASGWTDLFLYPGKSTQVVDALVTNFHLPRSTLLMLVAAMVGREKLLQVYAEAIAQEYRFYSYGDGMLIL